MKASKHLFIVDLLTQWSKLILYIVSIICMIHLTSAWTKEPKIDEEKNQLEKDLLRSQIRSFQIEELYYGRNQ